MSEPSVACRPGRQSATRGGLRVALAARFQGLLVDLWAGWKVKAVRRGFYGTALIALGALSPAYLPRSSPWWRLLNAFNAAGTPAKLIGTAITMIGAMMLVDAWLRVRPRKTSTKTGLTVEENIQAYRHLKHWAILTIWAIPFLLAPPIFSHDAYSYAAQGWMTHNGINPYHVGPGTLPGPFADQVAWVWRFTPAPYGPLSLQIQHLLVDLCGFQPYISAVVMRLPALVGVFLISHFLPRIATQMHRDAAFAAWFGVLNPLLVINFIGGAHNDSLMMGFVVSALWFAYGGRRVRPNFIRSGWLIGAVLVGVGAAIKQPAILAAYAVPLIARPWKNWSLSEIGLTAVRVLTSFGVAIGVFSFISWATRLGFGWIDAVNVPGLVVTISPFTLVGQVFQWVINLVGLDSTGHAAVRASRTIGLVIAGSVMALLALTVARKRPVSFLWSAYLVAALGSPALHSWYMQWGGTLLPLSNPEHINVRVAVWATIVLLSYDAINMSWRNNQVALGVATLFSLFWLVRTHHLGESRQRVQLASDKEE